METVNTQLPAKLNEAAVNSGLEVGKAQKYAMPYAPLLGEITEFANEVQTLDKLNPEHVARAKRISLDLGKICSKASDIKKADKAEVLAIGRYLDALFNTTEGAARLTQSEANEIVNYAAKLEAERIEKLRAARWNELSQYLEVEPNNLGEMDEVIFSNLVFGAKATYEAKIEAEKKAEAERLERERKEKIGHERLIAISPYAQFLTEKHDLAEMHEADFNTLISSLQKAKFDYETEQAEIKAENERLKKEADAKEKALELEREKARKEAEKLEQQRQSELKAEREKQAKLQAELQAKKDAEAKAERERLAAEQAAKKEAEKLAKAPIKTQMQTWINSFELPETNLDNATVKDVQAKFNAFKQWALTQVNNF